MSIWSDMGLIEGKMRGVNPCTFLNAAYRFFQDLQYKMSICAYPNYAPPSFYDFSFERMVRYHFNMTGDMYGSIWMRFQRGGYLGEGGAFNMPIPENLWNSSKPDWEKVFSLTEKDLLGEEVIVHPSTVGYGGAIYITDTSWQLQRYRLIQQMRYVTVPLNVRVLYSYPSGAKEVWLDWGYDTGCIDDGGFKWFYFHQIEAEVPEYWRKEGTVCKIGINSEYLRPYYSPPPFDGDFWRTGGYIKSGKSDHKERYSKIKLYGAIDLATHPDFKQYFDTGEVETPEKTS